MFLYGDKKVKIRLIKIEEVLLSRSGIVSIWRENVFKLRYGVGIGEKVRKFKEIEWRLSFF